MRNIFAYREAFRPFEYPEFAEFHLAALQSPWSHLEVSMSQDIADFNNASPQIQSLIGGILRGFTLTETLVGEYWRTIVCDWFSKHEIICMASAFTAQEALHALAYNHLDATLGLDSFAAFQADESAKAKFASVTKMLDAGKSSIAESLAIFSGGIEGVSLYSSFAVLLSLSKFGLFKGMSQILSWSVLDEELHSKAGIALYKQIIAESPASKISQIKMHQYFSNIVDYEIAFISNIFKEGDLPFISFDDSKAFVKHRANKKLAELGYAKLYSDDANTISDWFYPLVHGTVHTDFFAQARSGGSYSAKLEQDFSTIDISSLSFSLGK